ncbi:hypothetical protein E3U55_08415 [Filobacillus milosensis]|uniref:Uncharacterized protein n=1 Tax=Filobacillus milosensis TaxID=94137 RepID=A0A4Y8INA2_9BACI|nr:DUF5694 domain-containing protein [Filobacillus milosensis]TFB21835.1 hypothetical protein E3U55_08415 [Filobacillus milosensis]
MKPKILILGTFHFSSQLDVVNTDFSPKDRQQEILDLIKSLKEFKPTKVAVEALKDNDKDLKGSYQDYLNDSFHLTNNEIHQVGFRLAKQLNHEKVYPVDWMGDSGTSIGDALEYAEKHQPDLHDLIMNQCIPRLEKFHSHIDRPIKQVLKDINIEEVNQINKELYLHVARVGRGTDYVGADYVKWWYQRNLIIFSNIAELAESNEDRILLLIGSGHVYIVKQFLEDSGLFDVEEAVDYL